MRHLALFGTSADPPTAGHQAIIHWLSRHYDFVVVWASDNPFKSHQTPLEHRAAMLTLLINDIDPPRHNIGVYPELSSPRALVTVEKVRQRWPDAELTLVIGSDLVGQIPRWYQAETLFQSVHLLVIPRPGYAIEPSHMAHLQRLGAQVAIANLTGLPVSSTTYRESHDPDVLPPPIEAYIHREQLYACQDGARENS